MNPQLDSSRDLVARAGRTTRYLIALSIALMCALAVAFAVLAHRQETMRGTIREDALWATYQLDRETRSLSETLTRVLASGEPTQAEIDSLTLNYDVLYSRLSILDNAKYAPFFENSRRFNEARDAIRAAVIGMQPAFDRMAAGGGVERGALAAIAAELREMAGVTNDLLVFTNTVVSALRAEARDEIMQLQRLTAVAVLALLATIAVLIVNLMRQLSIVKAARRQIEETAQELSDAYRAADAGNRAKSRFMATIGHEIRTPLNAILGTAELLSEEDLPERATEDVRVITSSGTALLEIINDILDFAKIEHNGVEPESVPFACSDLVSQAVRVMEGRAREQDDELSVDIAPDVAAKIYRGDPTQLRRVLLNLTSNAVKFTESGLITIAVREVGAGETPRLRFEVSDTGVGISRDAQMRLFSAFSQADETVSRKYGGTGLGLAICKRIVEALGGEIGVHSVPGKGSTFWFELPAEIVSETAVAHVTEEAVITDLPRLRVLLAEDNAVNRSVATQFLAKLGQTVQTAEDGREAVDAVSKQEFDLVLMDMQMPVMDGIAATAAIRALGGSAAEVPVIAMTANASDSDRHLCVEAGMTGFEAKPVSLKRLAAVIATHGRKPGREETVAPAPTAVVDEERVRELIDVVGEEGFRSLLLAFFEDATFLLRDLRAALEPGNHALADRTLHSLKGAADNLGFAEFAELAQRLRQDGLDAAAVSAIAAELDALSLAHNHRT